MMHTRFVLSALKMVQRMNSKTQIMQSRLWLKFAILSGELCAAANVHKKKKKTHNIVMQTPLLLVACFTAVSSLVQKLESMH